MSFGIRVGAPRASRPAPISEGIFDARGARRWGEPVAAELRALAREGDAELRAEGLLGLARREEAAGRVEVAAELYAEIVGANLGPHSSREDEASGGVAPGLGRGGRTPTSLGPMAFGGAPGSPLQRRAQEHLNAILGRGAFGPHAEFLLRNLAQQSSDPAMLFAMGTAGAVFRMTRLATLSRLASTPNPRILTQILGAGRMASLTGFALEAPAFTLAGRLGSEALGRRQDWSGAALGRDFASSYLVLGGLKLAGWASGAAYRRYASPVGAVREGPLQTLFQQTGMLGGILLGHALEEQLGLRPHRDGATTLTDSLAMLLQFNVAGRLTRQAFGTRFAAWERGLDLQSEALARAPRPSFPRPVWEALEPSLVPAGTGLPRTSGRRSLWAPQVLMMAGNAGEGGNGRPGSDRPGHDAPAPEPRRRDDPDTTMSFSTAANRPKAMTATEELELPGRDPLEVESAVQLIRRIQDPELNFRETLREHDMEFHLKAPAGTELPTARIERVIPGLIQYLNALAIGQSIPAGRRIVIVQQGEGLGWRRFSLIKGAEGFECHPPLPASSDTADNAPRAPTAEAAEIRPEAPASEAKPPSDPPQSGSRPAERTAESEPLRFNAEEEEVRAIPLRGQSPDSLPRLLALAARQAQRRGITAQVLLEGGELRLEDLASVVPEGLAELPEGSAFRLWVTESRRSFRARLEEGRLRWEEAEDKAWDHSAIFSTATVRSVAEAYQVLLAYARAEGAPTGGDLVLRFRGSAPSPDALAEFLAGTLDRFPPTGRERLQVEFSDETPPLLFRRGEKGRWERE
ncbi:hypothetical protein FBR05_10320 [Deltaproteobacteria bacterium PRO3]|nr:hypothetical protein [Deltaproteobacteria bacterium PRO3]